MEIWDLYNNERKKIGKIERGQKIPEDAYHLVVHVCIFNSKGEMLIQKRNTNKKIWPGAWDLTLGGSALAGETSRDAAHREISEELGLEIDFSKEIPYFTIVFGDKFDKGFDDYFLIRKDVDLKDVTFKDNEVEQVKWATEAEILSMIDKKEFISFHKPLISTIFAMLNQRGAMNNFEKR